MFKTNQKLGYVWLSESLKENVRKRKWRGQVEEKVKNKFKVNKLFLYITSNIFHRFNSFVYGLNNLKIYNFF